MIQQAYFMDLNGSDNKCITDKDLYVNSTGSSVYEDDFVGGHRLGRKDYHLLYLYSGELNIKYGKKRDTLKYGQLIIFPPKTPFFYTNAKKTKTEYMWINFTGRQAEGLINAAEIPVNTPFTVTIPQYIFEGFETFFTEFKFRPFLHELAISYKLMHLMVLFSRSTGGRVRNKKSGPLTDALVYIGENYTQDIATETLAEIEHLSCAHFRRLFKAKTGMTPTQYITAVRLKNAEQMLLETDLSIKEIAKSVGFSDQLYFSKIFSSHFGDSPSDFRKR